MNIKTRKLKAGSENGVIIAILAILLIIVVAIVGVVVAKDNAAIATFDGGKVTKKEYQVYYEMFSSYLQSYGYDSESIPEEILKKAASDKMILTDAKAAGVELSEEDKKEIDDTFSNEEYLDYFKQYYTFSIDSLKQIYYNDYLIQAYIEKLAAEADDATIEEYIKSNATDGEEVDMNEYDTSHILFSFTKDDGTTMSDDEKATLKTEAEEVLQKALNGEDFASLAKEYSDDTTASQGGQYTMYDDGYTVSQYTDTVKKMKVGEVYGELVETTYGYHIIKLNAKTENGRLANDTESTAYANTLFNNIIEEKNLQYDEEEFKKFVNSIDPNVYAQEDEADTTTDDTTTDTSTDTSTDTTTEE